MRQPSTRASWGVSSTGAIRALSEHELGNCPELRRVARYQHRRDGRVSPRIEIVAKLFLGADQRDVLDQPRRDRRGCFGLLAVEVQVLDELRFAFVSHAREHVVVKVHLTRTHTTDVEREHRSIRVRRALYVVGDDQGYQTRDLEVVRRASRAGTRKAFGERVAVEAVPAWRLEPW